MTKSVLGLFFVPGPLGGQKRVPGDVFGHAESIATFFMKNVWGSKHRIFSSGGVGGIGPILTNFDQILKSAFFARLSP